MRPLAVLGAVLSLLGCQRQPILVTTATAPSLEAVYVERGNSLVPVGDARGHNLAGATDGEQLFTNEGQPLGGRVVWALSVTALPSASTDGGTTADAAAPRDGMVAVDGALDARMADATAPTDAPAPVDGGTTEDAAPMPDGGPATADGAVIDGDMADQDAAPTLFDAASLGADAASDMGAYAPSCIRSAADTYATASGSITLGAWRAAALDVFVSSGDEYTIHLVGRSLVPDALYSVWLEYFVPDAQRYAVAPLDGLPNEFISDDSGAVDVHWTVSRDLFEVGRPIPSALAVGASTLPSVIVPSTTIVVTVVYHSNGQTNGNGDCASSVPVGRAILPGRVGSGVHPHLRTIPMPAIPRSEP